MKKSEIKVGGFYKAKVSDKLVTVKVLAIRSGSGFKSNNRAENYFDVLNTETNRKTTFRSAAKFREEVVKDETSSVKCPSCGRRFTADGKCHYCNLEAKPVGGQHGGNGVSANEEKQAGETLAKMDELEQEEADAITPKLGSSFVAEEEGGTGPASRAGTGGLRAIFKPKVRVEQDNAPHVVVEARAGTGKTTTLVEGLKVLKGVGSALTPSPQQRAVWDAINLSAGKVSTVCFVAFNKSIADELKAKVNPLGYAASTMHSMGYKAVRDAYGNVKVNEYRVQDIISEVTGRDIRELRRTKGEMIVAVEKLVGLCKMNLSWVPDIDGDDSVAMAAKDQCEETLEQLASHYEVELLGHRAEVFDLVPKILSRCLDVQRDNCIDYSDMIWLPVAADLSVTRYDLLLVDEAQDLNRCQQALAKKAGKRLILCGDPKQAIYGFAGADAESMPRMLAELKETDRGCLHLPLTVTRRCGKAIVAEAKRIVPDFDAFETNPEGSIVRMPFQGHDRQAVPGGIELTINYRTKAADGDMILCRVNAPLVSECFKFIKAGRKATIMGRDIAKGLISTIAKQKATDIAGLVARLSDWLYDETRKENAKRNPSESRLIALQDRYDCLMCFVEGADSVEEVVGKIERVFTDGKECPKCKSRPGAGEIACHRCQVDLVPVPGVRLSSIHKAKGLEAETVFLLEPKGATVPHPMAKSDWQREQEWNLRYVAITRAIRELVYVTESAKA